MAKDQKRFQGSATGGKVNSQPLMTGIDEAIPALVDLRNQMAQLDLDDEFGVDVSDYIVEEQEIITPPLPPQPGAESAPSALAPPPPPPALGCASGESPPGFP